MFLESIHFSPRLSVLPGLSFSAELKHCLILGLRFSVLYPDGEGKALQAPPLTASLASCHHFSGVKTLLGSAEMPVHAHLWASLHAVPSALTTFLYPIFSDR